MLVRDINFPFEAPRGPGRLRTCQDGSPSSRIISPPARRAGTEPTAGAGGVAGWVLLGSGWGCPRWGLGEREGALDLLRIRGLQSSVCRAGLLTSLHPRWTQGCQGPGRPGPLFSAAEPPGLWTRRALAGWRPEGLLSCLSGPWLWPPQKTKPGEASRDEAAVREDQASARLPVHSPSQLPCRK